VILFCAASATASPQIHAQARSALILYQKLHRIYHIAIIQKIIKIILFQNLRTEALEDF